MEITPALIALITVEMTPLVHKMNQLGYKTTSDSLQTSVVPSGLVKSLGIDLENTSLDLRCEIRFLWTQSQNSWELSFGLFKDFRSFYLSRLLPNLQGPYDPSSLQFNHSEDDSVLKQNMNKSIQALLILMDQELSPLLKGEKWIDANLSWER